MGLRLFLISAILVSSSAANALLDPNPPQRRDYSSVQTFLGELVQTYKQTTELIEIGQANTGESIVGVKIGNGSIRNLIVGTHHGNEYGSTEVALAAALSFAKNPIANQTIYIIPVLNVSGFNSKSRQEKMPGSYTLDPNRDYPGPCDTNGPFKLKSTKALADFVASEGIVASATLHTYANMVLYPWGVSTQDVKTADHEEFLRIGAACARHSGYKVGNSTEELYPADGTFEDYAYWAHGIWSILFEMGNSHSPTQTSVDQMISGNVPGLRAFFEEAPTQRAAEHQFRGKCEAHLRGLNLRYE